MKRKLLTETPVCPRERLVIISHTTGLSFASERIGPLAAISITVFYLLVLYLFVLPNTPENPFASIYSESLIKTTCQHLLLLVGFDTLIYQKYYDTPLYLWVIKDHMCSPSVNALLRYSIKRSTLITSSFPWVPTANRLVGQKMLCNFLIASTHDYLRNTCLWLFSTRMLYHYLSTIAHVLLISWIILSMQRPYIYPHAYCI
jgi:hypothetical protein